MPSAQIEPPGLVRAMRPDDTTAASTISGAAGERFSAVADPRVASCADDPPFLPEELSDYVDRGQAWVATDGRAVVGFVIVAVLDGCAHIEEVDVAPAAGRRGHGSRLVLAVTLWARATALDAVTLTTFRDVPWNQRWYERQGYRVLAEHELTPGLRRAREEEHSRGLPADLRVVMRLDLRIHGHQPVDAQPCGL